MSQPIVRIVRPSSRELADLLTPRLAELRHAGLFVRYEDIPQNPQWAYTAGTAEVRAAALQAALCEEDTHLVWAARGGYGASDLLPLLNWALLGRCPEKIVIGFSDVSALHSALYAKLGWRGWHAPMPATSLWRLHADDDVDQVLGCLRAWAGGQGVFGEVAVAPVTPGNGWPLSGRLFGGCFSVLTGLIGTSYFPPNLKDHILFFEDVDESPARLMRALNQWLQSGVLAGVQAIVVGYLKDLGANIVDCAPYVLDEIARRVAPIPVFHTPLFGHVSPNYTLPIGAQGTLLPDRLSWRMPLTERTGLA